jgi:hypothetical protein
MRGEISTGRAAKRHPLDWYVEQGWEWEQIVRAIGLREQNCGSAIWDPAAGYGHSGSRLQGMGFTGELLLSDLVDNVAWEDFENAHPVRTQTIDFLEATRDGDCIAWPDGIGRPYRLRVPDRISIWSNPPYSYKKVWYEGRQVSISEAFVRHALKLATDRVVMILPAKWLAMGKRRSRLVRADHPPAMVLHFCERPSMPPGDMIERMGARAYRGGMVDYCAIVWDVRRPTEPGETLTIWLPPLSGDA